MKDLGKIKLCLGLQIEYLPTEIILYQSTYTKKRFELKKVLKHFYIDDAHPLSIPMVVRSLNVEKDLFRPKEDDEAIFCPEVPYLSTIGALMYLANCIRPNIAFSVYLLVRYSSVPTRRH